MSERDDYWQDRLTEQEIDCERRVEALEAKMSRLYDALLMALPYVEGEGTESEIEQVKAALKL